MQLIMGREANVTDLICDNLRLAKVENSVEEIFLFLHSSFAQIYLELKGTEGYVFNHEYRERDKILVFSQI